MFLALFGHVCSQGSTGEVNEWALLCSALTRRGSRYTTPPVVREPGTGTVREKTGGESARCGWKQRSAECM